ncbi:glycoside hydrolase family 16 protein [Pedobacter sp. AW31-3R]|uniref:glycoside hydrolase family 16 protein n=1 Tax=Pedobacter sp. AW31-3R TaxID=3445781 RepID=UPI003FA07E35
MRNALLSLVILFLSSCSSSLEKDIAPQLYPAPEGAATQPGDQTITFSGYTWTVKNSGTGTMGPGPNYWDAKNVWVDEKGILHLKLSKDPVSRQWRCAEVKSTVTFGYGTYEWKVDGPIDTFDKQVVFGLFNYSGTDGIDEMDIEFARWGVQENPNLNYTIYPAEINLPTFHDNRLFNLSEGSYSTHRFSRTSTSVSYKSLYGFQDGDTNLFATATCSAPAYKVSTLRMPVYMNLWLFRGQEPADGSTVEILIHSFKFTPIL